jgi:hypothetical protein
VLLVKAARELEQVVGVARVHGVGVEPGRRVRGLGRLHLLRGGLLRCSLLGRCLLLRGAALEFGETRLTGDEALTQLFVLLVEPTQFDDDLVEEVIDLVLVVALAEFRRVEPLVDHIFRSQGHVFHLTHCSPSPPRPSGRASMTKSTSHLQETGEGSSVQPPTASAEGWFQSVSEFADAH